MQKSEAIESRVLKPRRRVALLIETSRAYGRDLLRGISRYSQMHANWSLLHKEMTIDVQLSEWMTALPISGAIARIDSRVINSVRELNAPCVDVRCSHSFPGIPQVETDDRKVGKIAFEHLWQKGFRNFAFCGFQYAPYSDARLNCYNDGAPEADAKPLGPFYELESSSPALALQPSQSYSHIQTTVHIRAENAELDQVAKRVLGVSLKEIEKAFE